MSKIKLTGVDVGFGPEIDTLPIEVELKVSDIDLKKLKILLRKTSTGLGDKLVRLSIED